MSDYMGYKWVEKKPGEWWHAQLVDGNPWLGAVQEGNTYYPPDMYVSFSARDEDGKPYSEACWHLWKLYNGKMPDDPGDDDQDYWHICGKNALKELIEALTSLGDALK
jgi:hypothetical protein